MDVDSPQQSKSSATAITDEDGEEIDELTLRTPTVNVNLQHEPTRVWLVKCPLALAQAWREKAKAQPGAHLGQLVVRKSIVPGFHFTFDMHMQDRNLI